MVGVSFKVSETIASNGGPNSDGIGQWHKVKDISRFTPFRTTYSIIPKPSGTGKVEFTLESDADMDAGTATGISWKHGFVSGSKVSTDNHHLSGFRVVCNSGTVKMNARGA